MWKASASPRPIPDPPPVTKAVFTFVAIDEDRWTLGVWLQRGRDLGQTLVEETYTFTATSIGQGEGKDPVIIRPAPDTRQERVIDVLNACAAGMVKNLTFS